MQELDDFRKKSRAEADKEQKKVSKLKLLAMLHHQCHIESSKSGHDFAQNCCHGLQLDAVCRYAHSRH